MRHGAVASSSTSARCLTWTSLPRSARPLRSCSRQPGLAVTISVGLDRQRVVELALLQLARLDRVGDVVDAGAAAAQAGFVDLGQLQAGDARAADRAAGG